MDELERLRNSRPQIDGDSYAEDLSTAMATIDPHDAAITWWLTQLGRDWLPIDEDALGPQDDPLRMALHMVVWSGFAELKLRGDAETEDERDRRECEIVATGRWQDVVANYLRDSLPGFMSKSVAFLPASYSVRLTADGAVAADDLRCGIGPNRVRALVMAKVRRTGRVISFKSLHRYSDSAGATAMAAASASVGNITVQNHVNVDLSAITAALASMARPDGTGDTQTPAKDQPAREAEYRFAITSSGSCHLRFGDETGKLRALKGAKYIHAALANPGVALDCKELESSVGGRPRPESLPPGADRLDEVADNFQPDCGTDPELSETDKEYLLGKKLEFEDLRDDAKESGKAEKVREYEDNIAAIAARLRNAEFRGMAKARNVSPEELSRKAVWKAIESAIAAIRNEPDPMPKLADFLKERIETAKQITYLPPNPPIDWAL